MDNFCHLTLRAYIGTSGLISIKFITPWSCLQFVLGIVVPEQKSFRGNVCYLTLSSVSVIGSNLC